MKTITWGLEHDTQVNIADTVVWVTLWFPTLVAGYQPHKALASMISISVISGGSPLMLLRLRSVKLIYALSLFENHTNPPSPKHCGPALLSFLTLFLFFWSLEWIDWWMRRQNQDNRGMALEAYHMCLCSCLAVCMQCSLDLKAPLPASA